MKSLLTFLLFSLCSPLLAQTLTAQGDTIMVTPKGIPVGTAVSKEIGSEGGTLATLDGRIQLAIPKGAVSSITTFSIQPLTNMAPGGLGMSYQLLPEGITFKKPVRLNFKYDNNLLGGSSPELQWIMSQANDGSWLGETDRWVLTDINTVTTTVSHFSTWTLGSFVETVLVDEALGSIYRTDANELMRKNKEFEAKQQLAERHRQYHHQLAVLLVNQDMKVQTELRTTVENVKKMAKRVAKSGLLPNDDTPATPPVPVTTPGKANQSTTDWKLNNQAAPVTTPRGSLSSAGTEATFTAPSKVPSENPQEIKSIIKVDKFEYFTILHAKIIEKEGLYVNMDTDPEAYYPLYDMTDVMNRKKMESYPLMVAYSRDEATFTIGALPLAAGTIGALSVPAGNQQPPFSLNLQHFTGADYYPIGGEADGAGTIAYVENFTSKTKAYGLEEFKRAKTSTGDCEGESVMNTSVVSINIKTYKNIYYVVGYFKGVLYEDNKQLTESCKNSIPHVFSIYFVKQTKSLESMIEDLEKKFPKK